MNKDYQLLKLKKVIESAHCNFLIGSGASRPFLDTLGDIEKNITYINDSDNEEVKKHRNLLLASLFNEYLEKCLFGNLFFNIENYESYIKSCIECNDGKADEFNSVRQTYNSFIYNINKLLNSRDIQLLSKQVNIFTTNVDIFLEESLEHNNCSFNDGFDGRKRILFDTINFHNTVQKLSTHYEYKSEVPLINLFKIHGSLSWLKSSMKSGSEYNIIADYHLNKLGELYKYIDTIKTDLIDYQELSIAIKSKDVSSLDLESYESSNIENFLDLYKEIVMINPTKKKFEDTTKNLHYYEMLRIYANHLERENSVLFVLGFSFSDEHILKITQRVAKSNPTLIIYILCASTQNEDFSKKFQGYNNVEFLNPDEGYFTLSNLSTLLSDIQSTIPTN